MRIIFFTTVYTLWRFYDSYGPAGLEVIFAILQYHFFYPDENFAKTLGSTFADAVLNVDHRFPKTPAKFWYNIETADLSPYDFLTLIALPHTVALLIQQDLDIELHEAFHILDESVRFGDVFHPESEESSAVADKYVVLRVRGIY